MYSTYLHTLLLLGFAVRILHSSMYVIYVPRRLDVATFGIWLVRDSFAPAGNLIR